MEALLYFLKHNYLPLIISIVISYLLGSISFSIVFTRLFTGKDIRSLGSGNAGATNVLRSVKNKWVTIFTMIGDFGKGILSVLITRLIFRTIGYLPGAENMLSIYASYIAGFFCFYGHLYPIWFKFKGGKGVLTTAGILLMVDWRVLAFSLSMFIIIVIITRYVSLGSVVAAVCVATSTFAFRFFIDYPKAIADGVSAQHAFWMVTIPTIVMVVLCSIVIFKHRTNITRLIKHSESKISFGSKK